ncbi:tail fiber protein [Synechococcus phage Bellamy]|uniref:Tail fiber n=1 Tax=Synechococcus phage Bellamy TaxID=2023996 RepID=A0A222YX47_9CAUD|nr:tail fiber protein [Synechococcus phage Bellamy]ASR76076.1 tail fiber [Synechococcus phage Bellamy]
MADRNGYIGRAPGDSSVTVARQVFSPTGVQTNFTFASGYVPGYLDVYLNGAKLIVAQDFTATDGSVVGLTSFAQSGDVVEAVAFKAFNAAAVTQAADFTVTGNQTNNGTLSVTGGTTLSNLIVTGITTLSAGSSVSFATTAFDLGAGTNLNIGIVTVTTLSGGEVNGSDANFTGILTAASASFSGNVSVGGTLTYEDVTNIDSVGVITAREGIKVTTGGIDIAAGGIEVGGISTFQGATNTFANGLTVTAGGISVVSGGSSIIGVVTATSFEGDGSTLSNLPSSGDANDITASLFT